MIAASIPVFRLSEHALDTIPTKVGPPEQPKSPANANKANKAVPPFFNNAAALLKLPGHIIPTDKPKIAQLARETIAFGISAIHKYDTTQRIQLNIIKRSRSILSPNFP